MVCQSISSMEGGNGGMRLNPKMHDVVLLHAIRCTRYFMDDTKNEITCSADRVL